VLSVARITRRSPRSRPTWASRRRTGSGTSSSWRGTSTGPIIKPGEVFSFNRVVGERTVERGFREGQMIVGRCCSRRSAAASARPRRLSSTTRSSSASRSSSAQPQLLHQPLPDGPRRDGLVGRPDFEFRTTSDRILIKSSYTSSTLTFTVLRHESDGASSATTSPQTNWRRRRRLRVRPVRGRRLDSHVGGLEPERVRRHGHRTGLPG
jgi:hypothetical protein